MKSAPSLFLFFTGLVILMPTGVMSNFIFARNASDSLPSSPCAFSLSASAPFNSTLWQFPDGQIRLNGSYDKATFLIDKDGGLTDTRGFGCFIGGGSPIGPPEHTLRNLPLIRHHQIYLQPRSAAPSVGSPSWASASTGRTS